MNKERKQMTAVKRCIFGMVFLYLNINIQTVNILPHFVGWLFMASSVKLLDSDKRDIKILNPFAVVLAVWYAGIWIEDIFSYTYLEECQTMVMILGVLAIYVMFRIFSELATVAYEYGEDHLSASIRKWRNVIVIMQTVAAIISQGPMIYVSLQGSIGICASVLMFIAGILMILMLHELSKMIKKKGESYERKEEGIYPAENL